MDEKLTYYRREELELMTTFQLRDICWRERIINGTQLALDKDELIRQILRFRGRKDNLFIKKNNRRGVERLEELLKTANLYSLPKNHQGLCEADGL